MADVIDNGLRYLRKSDLAAIAEYIQSLSPLENALDKEKTVRRKKSLNNKSEFLIVLRKR